jgi:hypothetical protein
VLSATSALKQQQLTLFTTASTAITTTTQQEAGSAISRDEWEMHGKTISEGLGCLNWVAVAPPAGLPKDIAESAVGGSDYWANKIRVTYKKSGPAEQVRRKYCSSHDSQFLK